MATTTNYSWTTPDDTDLVKNGASAIRTLGTAIDTTTKNLNPSTTLGDIEYRSSTANTNTRLGIGSSGQNLQVVAGVPSWAASSTSTLTTTGDLLYASAANTLARRGIGTTGDVLTVSGGLPTWAAPASPSVSSNWSLFSSATLTGASTITISGISGKDKIMVFVANASSNTASSQIDIRLNSTTTGYSRVANEDQWYTSYNGADHSSIYASTSGQGIKLGYMANVAGSNVNGAATITGCNSSGVKQFIFSGAGTPSTGTGNYSYVGQGFWDNTATVSSVSLISSVGNFDNGTLYVYTSAS